MKDLLSFTAADQKFKQILHFVQDDGGRSNSINLNHAETWNVKSSRAAL